MIELLIIHFFLVSAGININYPWNITSGTNISNSSTNLMSQIPQRDIHNLPWYPNYLILCLYVALYVSRLNDASRSKYVYITFIGMIVSWLYVMFGLFAFNMHVATAQYGVPTLASALFIVTLIFFSMTRPRGS